ncbi:MAG: rhamnulokinase [Anaerolineae bacterium]|nr:rhamnulokinase [Anaerolineae bacterium]
MSQKHVIAVDLGAESGRVMCVGFDGVAWQLEEKHRFPNIPVQAGGTLYWDALRLWHEIHTTIDGIASGASSVGVDTWGVDFALLDRDGNLIANPVHYRDSRTDGMMDWVFERVPRRTIFERTGIQFMQLNTLYQLAALVKTNHPALETAQTLLTIPDLFHYWMTGEKSCEFTHVTTTQCYNPHSGDWDRETLDTIGFPTGILAPIRQAGTRLGDYNGLPVILPAAHDTGSAVAAVPAQTPNFAYLSSGTWSLLGLEVTDAVINDQSYAANVTNEGGYGDTFRLLKNIVGLWLAQQCQRTWQQEGREYNYGELAALAEQAEPFRCLVDPDDPRFLPPGDMPARIREFCQDSGQPAPETVGQFMRAIYESLALKYRYVLDQLIGLTGQQVDCLHVIGGGARSSLLCQMTADAVGRVVVAGPYEATALGNALIQMIALGEIDSVAQARATISRLPEITRYEPQESAPWEDAYGRFRAIMTTS